MRPKGNRRRISVAAIMAISFGALVFLSVGGVLALTVGANYRNTFDLLGARSTLLVDAIEDSLRAYLGQAEDAVDGVARLYAGGAFEIDDSGAMAALLSGALASTPGASGMLIYTEDFKVRGPVRPTDGSGTFDMLEPERESAPEIIAALEERRRVDGRMWGDFVANEVGLYANVSVPLVRGGVRRGWIIAPVELSTLSIIIRDLSARFETHAFILDGTTRVLADQRLADPAARRRGAKLLPALAESGDPVLARFAEREPIENFGTATARDVEISEIATQSVGGDQVSIAITRTISGYGERPWTIGAYYDRREIGDEVARVWLSEALGVGALCLAVIASVVLGKRLARPVRAIADQAQRVAEFDLDGVKPLPRSRVVELDDQAVAFNAMLTGLRAFSTYIPRSLVAKLVRTGEIGVTQSREAMVTVMFTDIVGFTTISEQMEAGAASRLLNHHFAILCHAVDAQGGTVDKFLGDGMMSFFGAPDSLKGHGAAAVRAAIAIREAMAEDNRLAAADNRPALRVRIGIHTGRVIVGNIGAADRVNYTIVGDTVNVSQRLQELGKLLAPGEETAIVISVETATRLGDAVQLESAGLHRLRGRGEPMQVFVVGDVADEPASRAVSA